jgi:hypothetical protein
LALLQGIFDSVSIPIKPGRQFPQVLATLPHGALLIAAHEKEIVQSTLLSVREYAFTNWTVRVGFKEEDSAVIDIVSNEGPLVGGVTVTVVVALPDPPK